MNDKTTSNTLDLAAPDRSPQSDGKAEGLFRPGDVSEILGLSRRQLQYWARTDLINPSGITPGGHRRYSFEDLVALKAAKRLIDSGVSVQRIRTSIQALRHMLPRVSRPLSELTLVATGDMVLVFHRGAAFEAVSGQEWVFEVAQFQSEVEAWQTRLDPNRAIATDRSTTRVAGVIPNTA